MSHPRTICLHGPESTGKSTLITRLARHFDTMFVPEYGRTFAERRGIDFTMADLVTIAETHDAMTQSALATGADPLFLDTDPLMTAVWADMLFGTRDPWFARWKGVADLYLLLDIDLPWVDDGTRMFGSEAERRRFFDLSKAELNRRGVAWTLVGGAGEDRFDHALTALHELGVAG
ncbi:AAA family ATPase [Sphingomonas sp. GlSt437]|uniref:AAA family ATPase n=1 Tax=Sphingomonas sp. GlSt437 TaxID=3389970 RepID=UPI003A8C253C